MSISTPTPTPPKPRATSSTVGRSSGWPEPDSWRAAWSTGSSASWRSSSRSAAAARRPTRRAPCAPSRTSHSAGRCWSRSRSASRATRCGGSPAPRSAADRRDRIEASIALPRSRAGSSTPGSACSRSRSCSTPTGGRQGARRQPPRAFSSWPAGPLLVGLAGSVFVGIAGYQAYRGVTRAFLEDSKTEEMRPEVKHFVARIGTVGHLARAVVFGLVGAFLIKAAVEYNARAAVGLDGALAKVAAPDVRSLPARGHSVRLARLRALLDQRRPLPSDLASA